MEPYPNCPPGCGAEHHFHPWTAAIREPGSVLCRGCYREWVRPGLICDACELRLLVAWEARDIATEAA